MNTLTWSPTISCISQTIANKGQLRLIVSPYIKLNALRAILRECKDTSQLQVVVRWQSSDLLNGVTDADIYPYLRDKRIPLFRHTSIHLKLFIFNRSTAFHTSGNVTSKGLGLLPQSNLEIGCLVTLTTTDWNKLFALLSQSEQMDDQMYEQSKQYILDNQKHRQSLPSLTLSPSKLKEFTTHSLPASENPMLLYEFYSSELHTAGEWLDQSPEFVHDLFLYSIPTGLTQKQFFLTLEQNFKSNAFTRSLVVFLQRRHSASFGTITSWLANTCADSPRPFRRDLKTTTRHLYNWLAFFYNEISWNKPNYSMVIYWNN